MTTPAPSPAVVLSDVPSSHRDAVAELLGVAGASWTRLTGGWTSAVYRLNTHGLVVRFAFDNTSVEALTGHVNRAARLVAAGVPFASPALVDPLVFDGGAATVWHDLGDTLPVDYAALGESLLLLHSVGSTALNDDLGLEDVDSMVVLQERLDAACASGSLSGAEYDVLAPWIPRMGEALADAAETVGGLLGGRVLVHDDVWPKNVIRTGQGTYLLDPDNLGWGVPDRDLAFVVRALGAGFISSAQAVAFASGYGTGLPARMLRGLMHTSTGCGGCALWPGGDGLSVTRSRIWLRRSRCGSCRVGLVTR